MIGGPGREALELVEMGWPGPMGPATPRSVGFIGLGQMGFGMARNLLKAGHDVLAYDVAPEPLARFTAAGGRAARDPAQIGAEGSSVMGMGVDGRQVDAVLGGPHGLPRTSTPGTPRGGTP